MRTVNVRHVYARLDCRFSRMRGKDFENKRPVITLGRYKGGRTRLDDPPNGLEHSLGNSSEYKPVHDCKLVFIYLYSMEN